MEKIDDLTESLTRTTDVLSSADRMIDHYRNLNCEQEYVIAKLKEDLRHSNEMGQQQAVYEEDLLKSKQRVSSCGSGLDEHNLMQSEAKPSYDLFSDEDGRSSSMRGRIPHSPKVRFKEQPVDPEIDTLRSKMTEFQRKQELLESELETERQLHEEELSRLDTTIKRQLSFELSTEKSEINDNLKRIQQKLEEVRVRM